MFLSWKKTLKALARLLRPRRTFKKLRYLLLIGRSPFFDAVWYLDRYPDVRQARASPLVHYCFRGWKEMRDPSPGFSTVRYLEVYRDVAKANINPLAHYLSYGLREGRSPLPRATPPKPKPAPELPVLCSGYLRVVCSHAPVFSAANEFMRSNPAYLEQVILSEFSQILQQSKTLDIVDLSRLCEKTISNRSLLAETYVNDIREGIIVYTCLFNDYERLKTPELKEEGEGIRYMCFTDMADLVSDFWEVVRIDTQGLNPRQASRAPKILAHRYLPDHKVSIYLDASFTPKNLRLREVVAECLGDFDLALYPHHARDCVYAEARHCVLVGREPLGATKARMSRYFQDGFPVNYGLFENGFIVRRNVESIRELNELWWHEYKKGNERDQFSLMYCLWKLTISANAIPFGKQIRINPYADFSRHQYVSYINSDRGAVAKPNIATGAQRFAFIAAAYNKESAIGHYIRGIFRQRTPAELQVIIVDDNSSDGTLAEADKVFSKGAKMAKAHLKLLSNDRNLGNCASRNIGVRDADADFLCITDADCMPNSLFVETHIRGLNNGCVVSIGPMGIETGGRDPERVMQDLDADRNLRFQKMKLQWPAERSAFVNCVTRNLCLSRSLADLFKDELFDLSFSYTNDQKSGVGWEDVELGARLWGAGATIGFQEDAYTLHISHPSVISRDGRARGAMRNFRLLLTKHPFLFELYPSWTAHTVQKMAALLEALGDAENEDLCAVSEIMRTHQLPYWSTF